jgi:hypothetical protein
VSASDHEPVGLTGVLILATRASEGPGEVLVAIRGGREVFTAYSEQALPIGTNVLIIEARPAREVSVVAWDEFDPPDFVH